MTEKLFDNIFRLQIPLKGNPLKSLNSYIILGETNLLIDTGFRAEDCLAAMTEGLDELSVDLSKTDIFLTHLHSDHTGLAVDLHREGRKVYISEADGKRMIAYSDGTAWASSDSFFEKNGFPSDMLVKLRSKNPAIANAPPPFSDFTYVSDGDKLHYGGYELTAVATPGHTPGHTCLYIKDTGVLFLGDHILFDITPNITSWRGFDDSLGRYLSSLEKIKELPVTAALAGHREISVDMLVRANEIIAHHQRRLIEAEAAVRDFPGSAAYFIAGKMSWDIKADSWEDFPLSQRWFAVGETIAHLDRLAALGRVKSEAVDGLIRYYPI